MASEHLVALLDGQKVGVVQREQGRLSFRYDEAWRTSPGAYPLSLSMPLAAAEHGHRPVEAFLWGLLPDTRSYEVLPNRLRSIEPRKGKNLWRDEKPCPTLKHAQGGLSIGRESSTDRSRRRLRPPDRSASSLA